MQKRAARFVTRNYSYETGSMTGILEELKWETLQMRRKDNRLILFYKGLKGKARVPTDDLIPKNRRCRNQHSLFFQIPTASKDAYKKSFFPQTIRDWNVLPDSLISSAELSDDCLSKGLGSPTGLFSPVLCLKFKHNSQSYKLLYPPQTVFVGEYTVFTLSESPTDRPCVRNVLFL